MDGPTPRSGSLQEQREHRLAKIDALRASGVNPYPVSFPRDHTLGELRSQFDALQPGEETDVDVKVAGRIFNLRDQGGLIFATIHDQSGHIQLFVSRDALGDDGFHAFADFDVGDWIGAEGTVMVTQRGEESVKVKRAELLAKGIRPLPNKGRGLRDPETRLRQRYLDLIVDPETRRVFDIRSKTIAAIRRWYHDNGWTEVETPVLQPIPGGATARPFITHYNALELNAYLRIALELYLKRLIVGGYEKVYEIGRVYRNEGVDTRHNPEFTLLESYQAFADYTDVMEQTEQVVAYAAQEALGTTEITIGDQPVDLKPPWRRASMAELVKEVTGVDMSASMPVEDARKLAEPLGIESEASWGAGRIMDEVYDAHVEHTIVGPLFVTDHPREVSPLAKPRPDDPTLVERFEVVVGGRELANAYSELNDPVLQLANFQGEAEAKAEGDTEVGDVDESGDVDLDYIRALEYGMPPTGGLGIGIDRLVMLLAGAGAIRDVILFPTLRPEADLYPHAAAYQSTAPEPPAEGDGVPERALAPVQLPPREEGKGSTSVQILAWLTGLAGLVTLLATFPGLHSRLGLVDDDLLGEGGRVAGHVASVVLGFILILTAFELARRKRTAWIVAVTLLAAATVVHVLKGPHLLAAAISTAMLVALLVTRRYFVARSDPPTLFAALRFVLLYLAAVLAYGFAALIVERDALEPALSFWGVLETIFLGLIGLDGPYTYESSFFADFFPASLLALGILGLVLLAWLVFRPVAERSTVSPDERARARALVHRYGWDTLAYFDLRDDKSLFFSSDGQALIAYAYLRGHALASGDPVGAPESIDLVLDEFLAFCRERGWRASFLAVRESELARYQARGLRSLYLGDEAIVRCDRFTLKGQRMKKVREAVNRVGKQHRFKLLRESEATPELVGQLNAISEAWRGKNPERGFTMSLSQDVAGVEPEILLAVARGPDGKPAGFLRLVPAFGDDPGYSLDLMRHDPDAQNGVTEYLIAQSALALRERGVQRLSMNFAAWGRLFHAEGERTLRQRLTRWLVGVLNPFFQIESLYSFNEKFDPDWLPRVVVYESEVDLPEVGILYAGVEGFLDIPVVGRYLVPRVVTETAPDADSSPPAAPVPA